ncbi:MAG TPA: hydrolase [Thermodesulfovibrionales bacterium]|nr:hydrolase [Thermodesulfovibrionales bacterium]
MDRFFLRKNEAVLVMVDIQERLAAVMDERRKVVSNTLHLIEAAKLLNIPIILTEQYPKGLGITVSEIRDSVPSYEPIEKMMFGCCGEPAFLNSLDASGRRKVVLAGMETHVCVLQTCIGLLKRGYAVHVVKDAVCSRTQANFETGVGFMGDAGAVVTCTETVLFQVLEKAGTDEFKVISKRIK